MAEHDEIESGSTGGEGTTVRARSGGFAAGLLLGVLIGAGVALLAAPERGSRTRRTLRRGLRRLRDEAGEGLERAGNRTRKGLTKRRRELEARLERARARFD